MLSISRILFLFLCFSNVLFSAELPIPDKDQTFKLVSPPLPKAIDQKEIECDLIQQAKPSEKSSFSDNELAEMEMVFKSAPKDAQNIVKHLQDPNYFKGHKDYRSAYFVGEPGCGKTTMAKAIAYQMSKQGWTYKIISSTQLLRSDRNNTSIQLEKELEAAAASTKPILIIIDELNRLLENTDSKNHDTDSTTTTLWTFLDRESENEKIFLIGTMNRIDKLPKPFKNRMSSDYIEFSYITDPEIQQKTLRQYFLATELKLDPEVTDDFLKTELGKMRACSGRNLKKICWITYKIQRRKEDGPILPIKKSSIIEAINEFVERNEKIGYNKTEETDEERQERYHSTSTKLQVASLIIQACYIAPQIVEKIKKSLIIICF